MQIKANKQCDLPTLVDMISHSDCLAIGGGLSWREPMAALRELIRQRKSQLHLLGSAHGIDVDMLCGAGAVAISSESYVGFEQDFGMAPNYRRACETGKVEARDSCCYTLVQQLRAAISGLPFMPLRSVQGTSMAKLHPEYQSMTCPFSGEQLLLVPAIQPDVALLHVQYADVQGNLHIEGPPVVDILFAKAANTVIATVEKIISTEELQKKGITIPYFYVTAVTQAEYGAHPTACYPFYAYDRRHTSLYYQAASAGAENFKQQYLQVFVDDCPEHEHYLQAIGGTEALQRLVDWQLSITAWQALYD